MTIIELVKKRLTSNNKVEKDTISILISASKAQVKENNQKEDLAIRNAAMSYFKEISKSIKDYEKVNNQRAEAAIKTCKEIQMVLQAYFPKESFKSEEETKELIGNLIIQKGTNMGVIMKTLKK